MDAEIQKMYNLFKADFHSYIDSMKNLSYDSANKDYLVQDSTLAFNFDKIKDYLYPVPASPTSCDAVYFNNYVVFIEFKNGYKVFGKYNNKYRKNCEDSARDSLMIYRYLLTILDSSHINLSNIKTKFIVVINSGTTGHPSSALAASMAKTAKLESDLEVYLHNKFTGKDFFGNDTFFTEVDVWNDLNFSRKLAQV